MLRRTIGWSVRASTAALLLGAVATLGPAQEETGKRQGEQERGTPTLRGQTERTGEARTQEAAWVSPVQRAHEQFRQEVTRQIEQAKPARVGTLDENELMITSIGSDRLLAGAPTKDRGAFGAQPGLPGERDRERDLGTPGRDRETERREREVPGRDRPGEGELDLGGELGQGNVVGAVIVTGRSAGPIEAGTPRRTPPGETPRRLPGEEQEPEMPEVPEVPGELGERPGGFERRPTTQAGVPQGAYAVRLTPDHQRVELVDENGRTVAAASLHEPTAAPMRPGRDLGDVDDFDDFDDVGGLGRDRDFEGDEDGVGENVPQPPRPPVGREPGQRPAPRTLGLEPEWSTIYLAVLRAVAPETGR